MFFYFTHIFLLSLDGMDYIKASLETSFRHDVSHYTSKQIHVNTGPKEGHLRDEFVVLEGLRIQKAEEEGKQHFSCQKLEFS